MLAADGNRAVLKEPQAVSDVVAELLLAVDDGARHEAESALVSTIAALSAAKRLREPPAFKFAAWNVRVAGVLLERFEHAGRVLASKPAGNRSIARRRAARMARTYRMPAFGTSVLLPDVARRADGRVAVLGGVLRSRLELEHRGGAGAAARSRRIVVGYRELSHDPRRALDGILAALEIESSAAALAVMTGAGRTYSKDANDRRPFDPKGAHRRPPLPPDDERRVRAITASRVEELERRRPQTTNQL